MYKILPQGFQVLLERNEPPKEKEKPKIIRLDEQKEREETEKMPFFEGKVIAVGQLCKYTKAGDIILYEKFTPIKFTYGGRDYQIIKEEYITAYLVPEEQAEA